MTRFQPVLVVEDNPLDLDLICRAFERCKLANPIEVARDGEEALAFIPRWEAGETRPLVILLDLKLSRLTGLEVLWALKANPVSLAIPVVVLSTSLAREDVHEAYALGANSYLAKPVDFDRFLELAELIVQYWVRTNRVVAD